MDETPPEVFAHLRRAWDIFCNGKKERTHTLMAGQHLFMPWLFLQLACSKDELFTWICTQPVELSFIIMGKNINAQLPFCGVQNQAWRERRLLRSKSRKGEDLLSSDELLPAMSSLLSRSLGEAVGQGSRRACTRFCVPGRGFAEGL